MDKSELLELAQRFPTPFYLFEGEALERRVAHLREVLPQDTALCYAVKANPFLAREVSALVERLEICSPGEYAICRQLGLEPSQYVISGVYKDPQWMEELASREDVEKMICTVESMAQYHLLCQVARKHGRQLKLLLRLTSGSQFGLERQEIHQILAQPDPQIEVRGIQYFSGTQKTSVKRLGRELRMLEEFLSSLQDQYGPIPELELGPGFPVSYFADDAEQDEEVLLQAAQQLAQLSFPGKLTLELGRSIAASCGMPSRHGTHFPHLCDPGGGPKDQPEPELRHCGRRHPPAGLLRPEHGHAPSPGGASAAQGWRWGGELEHLRFPVHRQ